MSRVLNIVDDENQEVGLDDPGHYCCEPLKYQLVGTINCRDPKGHVTQTIQCPKQMVTYIAKFREYQISPVKLYSYSIQHCPWCGTKFPESLRDKWYDELETLGIEDAAFAKSDALPIEFLDDSWWKSRKL